MTPGRPTARESVGAAPGRSREKLASGAPSAFTGLCRGRGLRCDGTQHRTIRHERQHDDHLRQLRSPDRDHPKEQMMVWRLLAATASLTAPRNSIALGYFTNLRS